MQGATRCLAAEVCIQSASAPADVLSALDRRGREWRDSGLPERLRPFGAYGLHVQVSGQEFEIWWQALSDCDVAPVLTGRVDPAGSGSLIHATIAQPRLYLERLMVVLLVFTIVAFYHRPDRVSFIVLSVFLSVVAGLTWIQYRLGRRGGMIQAEELAAILAEASAIQYPGGNSYGP